MKYSILIPAYNAAPYIGRCLESILAQTMNDYEVVIVDDGSTDGTLSLCQEYAGRDNRIRCVSQGHQGVAAARNRLLDTASGEWIVFIDADDYVSDDYLAAFDSMSSLNPDADVLVCNSYRVCNGKVRAGRPFNGDKRDYYHILLRREYWKVAFGVWGKAVCRSLIESRHLRFPGHINLGEDLYFLVALLYWAENMVVDNHPRYYYCKHEGSITNSHEYLIDDIRCTLLIEDFINSRPDAEKYRLSLKRGRMASRLKWYLVARRNPSCEGLLNEYGNWDTGKYSLMEKAELFCINHDMFFILRAIDKLVRSFF